MIRITLTEEARDDLNEAFAFYEMQDAGAGDYFASCLKADIASLRITAGIHRESAGFHRLISKVFPYAIFNTFSEETVEVRAIVDCRRNPAWIRNRLSE